MNLFRTNYNTDDYFVVTYFLRAKTNLRDAAWDLAIGQSVGNPKMRNHWESEELFARHSCLILHDEGELLRRKAGQVRIAFPVENIDFETDGVAHLLVNIMGGQLDIEEVLQCFVSDIEFPPHVHRIFKGPKYGITGIREFTGVKDKPLLGGILKPKTGVSPAVMLDMVKEMVEGGVNFIKEDEILSSPAFCRIEDRVPAIAEYLEGKGVVYCVSIHADPAHLLQRVKTVYYLGGNGVHVNFWCGMGAYKSIRDMDLPIFVHFQKSGDKIFTNQDHDFGISFEVVVKLAGMMGVDFAHVGMIGGYYRWGDDETLAAVKTARAYNVMPALSCGFHPGLVPEVNRRVGTEYMANVGGAMHGHPGGTKAGALAMRQAIDGYPGEEYKQAFALWGNK